MAVTKIPSKADALAPYTVTRALCVGGERVEVGSVIELNRVAASEMMTANKIAPYVAPPAAPVVPDKPAGKAAKAEPVQADIAG